MKFVDDDDDDDDFNLIALNTHRHGSLLLGFFFWPVFTATLTISLPVERRYLPPQ